MLKRRMAEKGEGVEVLEFSNYKHVMGFNHPSK